MGNKEVTGPLVAVLGGINTDICGRPTGPLRMRDSNIGAVSVRAGGVGRNIAHSLCLLGARVRLIAAVGGDMLSASAVESCRALGMELSGLLTLPEERSSVYLYIADESGDMCVGVNDMDIVKRLTPEYIAGRMELLDTADAVVLDANLPAETIAYVCRNCRRPIYADPVSVEKALRLKPVLSRLAAIKPNALEAEALTGERDAASAARSLLREGCGRVFISLGAEGLLAAEGDALLRIPRVEVEVADATGAGDAASAAIVWAGALGLSLEKTARAAVLAGAFTAACQQTNSPRLAELPQLI